MSVNDQMAQDLLWEYARRRRAVDADFSDDLQWALIQAGYYRGGIVSLSDGTSTEMLPGETVSEAIERLVRDGK